MEFCFFCLVASAIKAAGSYAVTVILPAAAAGAGTQIVSHLIGG